MHFHVLNVDLPGLLGSGILRRDDRGVLEAALAKSPVVLLVGARQAGKTTMARSIVSSGEEANFDLEDPATWHVWTNRCWPSKGSGGSSSSTRSNGGRTCSRSWVLADRQPATATFLVRRRAQ